MYPEFAEADLAEIVAGFRTSRFTRLDLRTETVRLAIQDGEVERAAEAVTHEIDESRTAIVSADLLGTFRFADGSSPASLASAQLKPETVIGTITVLDESVEVKAGTCGTVSRIDVEDGAFVEYRQPLLRLRLDEADKMRRTV
ncbi:hypothetical protein [uncultured Roseibium sp.]|uniref:hypothetical protein n=1 Tax=uncultured Roseibium sp. TaxID=1936171 RepID=UPI00321772D5